MCDGVIRGGFLCDISKFKLGYVAHAINRRGRLTVGSRSLAIGSKQLLDNGAKEGPFFYSRHTAITTLAGPEKCHDLRKRRLKLQNFSGPSIVTKED